MIDAEVPPILFVKLSERSESVGYAFEARML